ncbi:ABC transporter ATP-binding protein [uncultured Helcococcus sp.]|uniref:ABC transporter ATP-binding protein n=1 Tax=uncultured Helcococcus sp. TaxID=1072508 RepID=UPI00288ACF06|nr:ABC transporter ATP-binding protein [uncultured Helcococcus sp.]
MNRNFKDRMAFYFKELFPNLFRMDTWLKTIVNMIMAVIHPLMSVLVLKCILELIKNGRMDVYQLLTVAGIYTLVFIISKSLNLYLEGKIQYIFMLDRNNIMIEMIDKIMTMDFEYFEDSEFELEINQAFMGVAGDNIGYQNILVRTFRLLPNLILIIIFSILLLKESYIVFIVSMVSMLINLFLATKIAEYANKARPAIQDESRKYEKYKEVVEDFKYGKDIRIFSLKNRLLDNIKNFMNRLLDKQHKVDEYRFKISFLENLSIYLGQFVALLVFTYMAVNGQMTIATLIASLTILTILSNIIQAVNQDVTNVYENIQYVILTYDFLDSNLIKSRDGIDYKFQGPIAIKFDRVSFKYPGSDKYVFKDLSFEIDADKNVALVGVNGAGKTTIVKLLVGLYKPTEGTIYLDGINADDLSMEARFRIFSVVFQETEPLALTVAENIVGVENGINRERVKETLEKVGLWKKISSLENGIDQNVLKVIYEDGVILSGGENQKLMIARALYKKDTSVMVMDEPTSALDALAEEKIYKEFDSYMGNKTGIFISHRLASTRFCDEILFLDGGEISAKGSHQELMEKSKEYREMFETQGKYYKEFENESL